MAPIRSTSKISHGKHPATKETGTIHTQLLFLAPCCGGGAAGVFATGGGF
jgi:hypothetical protein